MQLKQSAVEDAAGDASHSAVMVRSKPGNATGAASLAFGSLAFVAAWFPYLNIVVGWPSSVLGLLLGVIGVLVAFKRGGANIGFPIVGIGLCSFTFFSVGLVVVGMSIALCAVAVLFVALWRFGTFTSGSRRSTH